MARHPIPSHRVEIVDMEDEEGHSPVSLPRHAASRMVPKQSRTLFLGKECRALLFLLSAADRLNDGTFSALCDARPL